MLSGVGDEREDLLAGALMTRSTLAVVPSTWFTLAHLQCDQSPSPTATDLGALNTARDSLTRPSRLYVANTSASSPSRSTMRSERSALRRDDDRWSHPRARSGQRDHGVGEPVAEQRQQLGERAAPIDDFQHSPQHRVGERRRCARRRRRAAAGPRQAAGRVRQALVTGAAAHRPAARTRRRGRRSGCGSWAPSSGDGADVPAGETQTCCVQ